MGIGLILSSCDGFLDVNENPNVATEAVPNLLFVSEAVGLSNNRTSEIWIPIGISSQVFASGGVVGWGTDEDQYNISIYSTGNTWRELYTNVLKNSTLAIEAAATAVPVNNNAIAQHKILQAYAFWEATAIWGDIPFSEAGDPDISAPKFDSQEEVLQGILNLLDDAISHIDIESPVKIEKEDVYFGGDMEAWKRFAVSMKLRVLMMMVDALPSKSTEIAALINTTDYEGIDSNDGNVLFSYYNTAGNYNPMYNLFYTYNGGVNNWLFAIDHTYDILEKYNDPRMSVLFDLGPDASAYSPLARGQVANPDVNSVVGSFFLQPDSKDPLFTYSEDLLLQAEAHAREFVGGMAEADAKMRKGITASMQYYGISATDISLFLAGIQPLSTMSKADALKFIAEQQWIDLYNRSLEAWTQWRRTEIPDMTPAPGALTTGMIRRWPYAPNEVAANPKTPTQEAMDVKMWFDK